MKFRVWIALLAAFALATVVAVAIMTLHDFESDRRGPYESCKQAKSDGPTPIRRGQSGYHRDLDRDNDGLACE